MASLLYAFCKKRNIFYGWIIVGVTFLTMMVGATTIGAPSILIQPFQKQFGWSLADISAVFATRLALFGLVGPFAAVLMNHFGVRQVTSCAIILIAIGVAGSFFMSNFLHLFLFWGIAVGIGTGFTAMVLGTTIATRWFVMHRGLVIGVLSASMAAGQLIFLPIFVMIMERYNWKISLLLILFMLLFILIIVLLFMRNAPSDLELTAYGSAEVLEYRKISSQTLIQTLIYPLIVLQKASNSLRFWILFGTFFICGATSTGLIQTHLVGICADYGMKPMFATGMLAIIGMTNLTGTIAAGWLADRFDSKWLLFFFYSLRGICLIFLINTDFNMSIFIIFAIFFGLDWLATVPPTMRLISDYFQGKEAIIFGWIFVGHQLGAAVAAWGTGWIRGAMHSYIPAFGISAILCFLSAFMILNLNMKMRSSIKI